ncbi:hypothetical protein FRC08_001114 [Ceratobasidium sp. 394]|nr:hypothetical protein FRC08_001114 [Ceratobasidium sp. 394]
MKSLAEKPSDNYTVLVSDTPFVLSRSQIERDAPNYLTSHFLDDSGHRIRESLEVSRDSDIFKLVLRYLNGYQVIPLHDSLIPASSTRAAALADLRADAEFYQLDGLLQACKSEGPSDPKYGVITCYFKVTSDTLSPAESFDDIMPRCSMEIMDYNLFQTASKTAYSMNEGTAHMENYLIVSGWTNRIAGEALRNKEPSVSRWAVTGWKRSLTGDGIRHAIIFVKFWT